VPAVSTTARTHRLNSVGSWSFILARPDLPDDVGIAWPGAGTRAKCAGAEARPGEGTTAANTAAAATDAALIQPASRAI